MCDARRRRVNPRNAFATTAKQGRSAREKRETERVRAKQGEREQQRARKREQDNSASRVEDDVLEK